MALKIANQVPAQNAAPAKGKAPRKVTPTAAQRLAQQKARESAVFAAHCYTGAAVALSVVLNAYHSAFESGQEGATQWVAGAIGGAIPLLVWGLCQVASYTHAAGSPTLAIILGVIATVVLILSIIHVSAALAALTGSPWALAVLLAIGIDAGLVASEATAILI